MGLKEKNTQSRSLQSEPTFPIYIHFSLIVSDPHFSETENDKTTNLHSEATKKIYFMPVSVVMSMKMFVFDLIRITYLCNIMLSIMPI